MLNPLVYCAEPLDQARGMALGDWEQAVSDVSLVFNSFRPAAGWHVPPHRADPRAQQANLAILDRCDVVLAYLPSGVPSIGVPMEIGRAVTRGTPAVVLTDVESVALAGTPGVTVICHPEEAIAAVEQAIHSEFAQARAGNILPAGVIPDHEQLRVTLEDGAELPARAYGDDAGIDLVCAEAVTVEPFQFVDIKTTVTGVQLPPWSWGLVTQRSSTLRKRGLHVPTGVIDCGWRGPLLVGVMNLRTEPVKVEAGDRLAQLVVIENATRRVQLVEGPLTPHPRGLNGFGSSGR